MVQVAEERKSSPTKSFPLKRQEMEKQQYYIGPSGNLAFVGAYRINQEMPKTKQNVNKSISPAKSASSPSKT